MFEQVKWMIIEFLIRHNVLAVARVKAQHDPYAGQRRYKR